MPMVREMISKLSSVAIVDDVNPDEAVAVGAAIQAILSLLREEEVSGVKTLPDDTRQQFSSREGGLIQVTNITSHTLGVVLLDRTSLSARQLRDELATAPGKIVPIVAGDGARGYDWRRLVLERTVTVASQPRSERRPEDSRTRQPV